MTAHQISCTEYSSAATVRPVAIPPATTASSHRAPAFPSTIGQVQPARHPVALDVGELLGDATDTAHPEGHRPGENYQADIRPTATGEEATA